MRLGSWQHIPPQRKQTGSMHSCLRAARRNAKTDMYRTRLGSRQTQNAKQKAKNCSYDAIQRPQRTADLSSHTRHETSDVENGGRAECTESRHISATLTKRAP